MTKRLPHILIIMLLCNLLPYGLFTSAPVLTAHAEAPSAPVNVALNKPASASASCNANTEGPSKAFDGNLNNKWCAGQGEGSWLQVYLEGTHIVTKFTIAHAGAGWEQPVRNTKAYRIQTSLDGVSWSDNVSVTANTYNVSTHEISPVTAKYVKLLVDQPAQVSTETAARINEFEVFGVPDPNRDQAAPSAPSGLRLTGKSDTSVTLTWNSSTDNVAVIGYQILNNTGQVLASVNGSTYAATINGLSASTAYAFTVKAVDGENNVSSASESVQVTTMPLLRNVALNKTAVTSGQCNSSESGAKALDGNIYTKWCQGNGANGWLQVELGQHYNVSKFVLKHGGVVESPSYNTKEFTIALSSDGTVWSEAVRVTGNSQSSTTHLINERSAKFVKLTIQVPEQGAYSTIRLPEFEVYGYEDPDADNAPPSVPGELTVSDTKSTKAKLAWSASSDNVAVTGYDVYVGTQKVGTTTQTTYSLTGLIPAKENLVSVRAKDASGNISAPATAVVQTVAGVFNVDGTKILNPDGDEFIIKGVNVDGYNWYWNRDMTPDSEIRLVKDVWKFNTIRVNSKIGPGSFFKDINHLYKIIDKYTAAGIVVQVEAHDFSGSYYTDTTTPSLTELAEFHKNLAIKYKDNPYVWFNIMNEPGNLSPQFLTTHEKVIKAIREEAGANNMIVVDGAQFASETKQNFGEIVESQSAVLTYGEQLASYGNVTFALHMYDSWESGGAVLPNGKKRLQDYIDKVHAKGLSFHIGEYGSPYNSKVTSVIDTVREVAGANRIGRIVWSWFAGDTYRLANAPACHGGYCIDRTDGLKPSNLTRQGNSVWNDNHNITDISDLGVTSLQMDRTTFQVGDKTRLLALVSNTGDKKVTGSLQIGFYINDVKAAAVDLNSELMFKESVPVLSPEITLSGQSVNVKAVIEPDSSYGADAKPDNNALTLIVQGQPAAIGADPLVAQVKPLPAKTNYYFGDVVTLEARIDNKGAQAATGGKTAGTFFINGIPVETVESLNAIAPGGSLVLKGTKPVTLTANSAISFVMNNTHTTADGNTTNNALFQYIALKSADHVNLALNPGFEQGDVQWTNWGGRSVVAEQPHTGAKALKVGPGVGGGGQDVVLEPNTTYLLTAWVKHDVTPNAKTEIGVQYRKAAGDPQTKHILYYDHSGDYALQQMMFTTPPSLVEGNLFVWKNSTAANAYVDDMYLTRISNLLSESGFESGLLDSGWVNYGLGFNNKAVVTAPVHTGAHALKLGTMAGGVKKFVPLEANTTYVLGAWLKHDKKPDLPSELGIEMETGAGTPVTQHKAAITNFGDFEYRQVIFTTPGTVTGAGIFLNKTSDDGGFLFVDDLVLTRIPNLLLNSGFESGDSNWSSYGNRTMAEERPQSGTKAVKVGLNVGGGQQDIQLEPNTTYILSVSGQVTSEDGEVHTGVQYRAQAGAEQIKHIIRITKPNAYETKYVIFTTPAEVMDANVFIWKPASGYYAYLDDYVLTPMPSTIYTKPLTDVPTGPQEIVGTVFGSGEAWRTGSGFTAVFDGKTDTYYDAKQADGNYAGMDAGEGNEHRIVTIRFFTLDTSWAAGRAVGGRFQGSNQSPESGYRDLHVIEASPQPGWTEISIADPNAYRYFRYLAPTGSHGNMAEVEFIGEKGEVIPDLEAPTKPVNLHAKEITDSGFTLTWEPSADQGPIAGYDIYNGTFLQQTITGSVYSVKLSGLTPYQEYHFTIQARDLAGNTSEVSDVLKVRTTEYDPPVIQVDGNKGTYNLNETVSITCQAVDELSGVASTTCRNITGPAYLFKWGINSYTFEATDYAGNKVWLTVTFKVTLTWTGLQALVQKFKNQTGQKFLTREQSEIIRKLTDEMNK
ncbi:hypothetical protein SY83_21390 [Paenibacillus swuensis]|uniref:Cellulase n=1 Tax=Paenibacillus swuensis TaxID=1178515 RepID=A0A172TMZ9_9BACL|nr:discoidin domain-containing protein [Paenibacillus swuensis]ANE48408.1 hypothetical protein SY83_21390 [Paenibacillus swuensis]